MSKPIYTRTPLAAMNKELEAFSDLLERNVPERMAYVVILHLPEPDGRSGQEVYLSNISPIAGVVAMKEMAKRVMAKIDEDKAERH
jgi:hypothetical protein